MHALVNQKVGRNSYQVYMELGIGERVDRVRPSSTTLSK